MLLQAMEGFFNVKESVTSYSDKSFKDVCSRV